MNRLLFVSKSIVYTKIVKSAYFELNRSALVLSEANLNEAIKTFTEKECDIVLIDTAIEEAELDPFIGQLLAVNPDVIIILLCDQKHHDRLSDQYSKHSIIVKPLDEGYQRNCKAIKLGINLAILKKKRVQAEAVGIAEEMKLAQAAGSETDAYSLLLIASSTGGPSVLEKMFRGFTTQLDVPVLIVQHMPPGFTKNLAATLNKYSVINVSEAEAGKVLLPGHAYIAPGGFHMVVTGGNRIDLNKNEMVNCVRPSADVLFYSVAQHYPGKKILTAVLTGMGCDGTEGVRILKKKCRCFCITQSEDSCTVYGMPRSVVEAKLSDRVVHLDVLAGSIIRALKPNAVKEDS